MSFNDTLRKNLTPELYTQVMDQLGDDFDFDLVPRSRLNKVIKQRNELRDQLAEGSQSQSSKGKASNEDDDDDFQMPGKGQGKSAGQGVDVEALKAEWLKEQGNAVNEVKMQYAALEKLRAVNAIDPDLIWQAGLIDKSKLTVEEDGTIKGLDEAITDLTKNRANLFGAAKGKDGVEGGTGKSGGDDSFATVKTKEDFLKLSTKDQMAFKKANPETFKSFLDA